MSDVLHLVRLVLNRRALLRVGIRHRLGPAPDEGALLHAGLAQLFAQSAERATVPLHTFAVDDTRASSASQSDLLFLLAYSPVSSQALVESMGEARRELLEECQSREFPRMNEGQRLGFRTRVCPVVRVRRQAESEHATQSGAPRGHREMDAFVHARLRANGATISREDAYGAWLARELGRYGASRVESSRVPEFRREVMRRRAGATIERPNAVMEGVLTVENPAEFERLMVRGVGRHRAFGFGMLLLRSAGT